MQQLRVPYALSGQHCDCCTRKRCEPHANHVVAGEFPQRQPYRVNRGELIVAIRGQDERARPLNAPSDESQKI